MSLSREKKDVVNIEKILKYGFQFKFFGSRQIYVMTDNNIQYQKVIYGSPRQKRYYLTEMDKKNIRSIYDPIRNRQLAKRKSLGGELFCYYQKN